MLQGCLNPGITNCCHFSFADSKTWSKVDAKGDGPSPRDKLASAVIGDKIYIFGGFGPQNPEEDVEEVRQKTGYELSFSKDHIFCSLG
jgi:amphiphysin